MYVILIVLLCLFAVFITVVLVRKKSTLNKINNMTAEQKHDLLNLFIQPFGFQYNGEHDIFSSLIDAPQRLFGYTSLHDSATKFFRMVFDCQTVYFDYDDKTWMIEFWKGQYSIRSGAEIGIYCSDEIIPPKQRSTAAFHSADDQNLMPLSLQLFKRKRSLFYLDGQHWGLTGFCIGTFSKPEDLLLKLSITFPTHEMLMKFTSAIIEIGYSGSDFYTTDHTVYLRFRNPRQEGTCRRHPLAGRAAQLLNRLLCQIYNFLTNPCQTTTDRFLLMYFMAPRIFGRICQMRIFRKKGARV